MVSIPQKQCPRCGKSYPRTAEYFHRSSSKKDGLTSHCKVCRSKHAKEYNAEHSEDKKQHYLLNRDIILMKVRIRTELIKDTLEFKARRRESSAKYYANHKEQCRESNRKSRLKNPDNSRSGVRNRRAKIRQADGFHTAEDIALIYKSQKGLCWWCGKALGDEYHVDHRIAIERGGSNWPNNLCISCPTCNMSKQDKLPHEWNGRLL